MSDKDLTLTYEYMNYVMNLEGGVVSAEWYDAVEKEFFARGLSVK